MLLHREVMRLADDDPREVDHIFRLSTTDNRESNLRIATRSENMCNRPAQRDNACGYKGVSYKARNKKYQATIMLNKKKIYLGLFINATDAANAYDAAARRFHGDFCNLNFPEGEREK